MLNTNANAKRWCERAINKKSKLCRMRSMILEKGGEEQFNDHIRFQTMTTTSEERRGEKWKETKATARPIFTRKSLKVKTNPPPPHIFITTTLPPSTCITRHLHCRQVLAELLHSSHSSHHSASQLSNSEKAMPAYSDSGYAVDYSRRQCSFSMAEEAYGETQCQRHSQRPHWQQAPGRCQLAQKTK